MTDKTDIAALLLEMRDLADRIVECQGENSEGEEIIHLYDQSDTTFKAENILLVLDALEAERHRADSETKSAGYWRRAAAQETARANKAEAELAALRGQKGQIAFRYRWVADEEHEASRWMYEDRPEEFDSIMKLEGAEWEEFRITPASKLTIKEAVSAYISKSAGIVVKDGE
ncbi:MAG: hypothetical protein ACTH8P_01305 [Ewingella sp.]|uniref:hypothetical protein n=1 Tax=Ewingella sp. TaxID=1897459 RepID=UPI003F8E6C11